MHKLKGELERIYDNLEKKNDLLMGAMMKNFGRTQQDLPNFKLPDIHQSGSKRAVAVDPFEDSLYPPKTVTGGTGILKQRTVRASYTAKRSLGGLYKNKKWRLMEKNPEAAAAMLEAANDPRPSPRTTSTRACSTSSTRASFPGMLTSHLHSKRVLLPSYAEASSSMTNESRTSSERYSLGLPIFKTSSDSTCNPQ